MAGSVYAEVVVNDEIVVSMIPKRKAKILVKEGRAEYKDENTIFIPLNSQKFKEFILDRDNHTCFYCGEPGETIDHKTPVSRGGYSTPVNCVCACLKCNGEKRNMNEKEYREFLTKKGEVND